MPGTEIYSEFKSLPEDMQRRFIEGYRDHYGTTNLKEVLGISSSMYGNLLHKLRIPNSKKKVFFKGELPTINGIEDFVLNIEAYTKLISEKVPEKLPLDWESVRVGLTEEVAEPVTPKAVSGGNKISVDVESMSPEELVARLQGLSMYLNLPGKKFKVNISIEEL